MHSSSDQAIGRWVVQLRKGLVELCVLSVLRAEEESYGYQILQSLAHGADGLAVSDSTVYPILARLEQDAVVGVRIVPSSSGPPRRYYHLTPHGRRHLAEMERAWGAVVGNVQRLIRRERTETPS